MNPNQATVFVVDDDPGVLRGLRRLLESVGLQVASFASAQDFLDTYRAEMPGCVVLDVRMPGLSGLDLQERLAAMGSATPVIFITGHADVPMSVRAMKAGAADFIEKPFNEQKLLDAIYHALERDAEHRRAQARMHDVERRLARLTAREREVLGFVVSGYTNGEIAAQWGISEKTIKIHRRRVMEKMEAESLPDLVLMAQAAGLCNAKGLPVSDRQPIATRSTDSLQ